MSDNRSQLIFEYHKGQSQFAYFLLGVAASAIAFAIHDTKNMSLEDAPWPLGFAVALWALSFALGCLGLDARQAGLSSNANYLQGLNQTPSHLIDQEMAQLIERAKERVADSLGRPAAHFKRQKWALFFGAIAYISGHLMQMAELPSKQTTSVLQSPPA